MSSRIAGTSIARLTMIALALLALLAVGCGSSVGGRATADPD
jgi:hypothetical protein